MVADSLLRLLISKCQEDVNIFLNRRVFEDTLVFPLNFQGIKEIQDNEAALKKLVKDKQKKESYKKEVFQEVERWNKEGKTYASQAGRSKLIKWFHENLTYGSGMYGRENEAIFLLVGTHGSCKTLRKKSPA